MNNPLPLALLWVLAAPLFAVDLSKIPPPEEPILAPPPPLAAWIVQHASDKPDFGADPTAMAVSLTATLTVKETRITRGPDNKRITRLWSDGSTTTQWYCKGATLYEQRGRDDVYIFTPQDLTDRYNFIPNYSLGDFPEVQWVSLAYYSGPELYRDRLCYVFKLRAGKVTDPQELMRMERVGLATAVASAVSHDLDPQGAGRYRKIIPTDPNAVIKIAYLDVKTHLPVAYVNYGKTSVLTMVEPPTEEPQPPERFLNALRRYISSTNAPTAPPR